jgi:hypothetical protein
MLRVSHVQSAGQNHIRLIFSSSKRFPTHNFVFVSYFSIRTCNIGLCLAHWDILNLTALTMCLIQAVKTIIIYYIYIFSFYFMPNEVFMDRNLLGLHNCSKIWQFSSRTRMIMIMPNQSKNGFCIILSYWWKINAKWIPENDTKRLLRKEMKQYTCL